MTELKYPQVPLQRIPHCDKIWSIINNKISIWHKTFISFTFFMFEVADLIKSIESETDMKKIAKVTHEGLHLMSLFDACQFKLISNKQWDKFFVLDSKN